VIDSPGTLSFTWPIDALGINSLFGPRTDPIDGKRRMHNGVDLDGPYGGVVMAAAPGLVVHTGWSAGHGRQVIIEHAGGFRTSYSHLSQVLVFEGQNLPRGAALGRLGNSGRSTGPHLHFEISRHGQVLDPLTFLEESVSVD
jgi:murein DD-endopeptidase MepM/ murein hydrolase activator NlpD